MCVAAKLQNTVIKFQALPLVHHERSLVRLLDNGKWEIFTNTW
ncbi:MAG: hypothetical protein QNJ63_23220 [Calothrix sp. MO_192.B10]|nr:hypothetical protein [Calothrix sp. MO_192.B10]